MSTHSSSSSSGSSSCGAISAVATNNLIRYTSTKIKYDRSHFMLTIPMEGKNEFMTLSIPCIQKISFPADILPEIVSKIMRAPLEQSHIFCFAFVIAHVKHIKTSLSQFKSSLPSWGFGVLGSPPHHFSLLLRYTVVWNACGFYMKFLCNFHLKVVT